MKRFLTAAGASVLLACAFQVQAQAYPTKSVRWLIPFPPGSASDITARVLADQLTKLWGQEEFASRHRNDVARWGRVIKEVGIKLD